MYPKAASPTPVIRYSNSDFWEFSGTDHGRCPTEFCSRAVFKRSFVPGGGVLINVTLTGVVKSTHRALNTSGWYLPLHVTCSLSRMLRYAACRYRMSRRFCSGHPSLQDNACSRVYERVTLISYISDAAHKSLAWVALAPSYSIFSWLKH